MRHGGRTTSWRGASPAGSRAWLAATKQKALSLEFQLQSLNSSGSSIKHRFELVLVRAPQSVLSIRAGREQDGVPLVPDRTSAGKVSAPTRRRVVTVEAVRQPLGAVVEIRRAGGTWRQR